MEETDFDGMNKKTKDDLYDDRKKFYDNIREYILNIIENPMGDKNINFTNSGENYGKIIALDAPWGYGKSFICDILYDDLHNYKLNNRNINVKKINAWESQKYKNPLYAFMLADTNISEDIKMSISLNLPFVSIGAEKSDMHQNFTALKSNYDRIQCGNDAEYVFYIIDNLDRCTPAYIMEFLEVLQHVVSMNCAIVSVNLDALNDAFSLTYGSPGEKYYDKIFHKTFKVPFDLKMFKTILNTHFQNISLDDDLVVKLYKCLSYKNNLTPRLIYKILANKENEMKKILEAKVEVPELLKPVKSKHELNYISHALLYHDVCLLLDENMDIDEYKSIGRIFNEVFLDIDQYYMDYVFKVLKG